MTPEKFIELLNAQDIDSLIPAFTERSELVQKYLKDCNIDDHEVMKRQDKWVDQADGTKARVEAWRLPVPYQEQIVEVATAFLYGKPIRYINNAEKGKADEAFKILSTLRKKMRMPAKDKEVSRKQMYETIAARLFVPYKDKDTNEVKLKCLVLAESLGDTLYIKEDIYGSFEAVARGYVTKVEDKETKHFDIYQDDFIYYCTQTDKAWTVDKHPNLIQKIPVSVWMQDKPESWNVRHLIRRYEYLNSRRADSNDRVAEPILFIEGDPDSMTLPAASEAGKVIVSQNGAKASYMTPDMAVDLVKLERENLKEDIQFFTNTPDISMDKMMQVGTTSGKAMELLFFQAILKAMAKQEVHEEMHDREVSIIKAFIGNVYDITLKAECEALEVGYEFGNPLPDNYADLIETLNLASGGKPSMSQRSAVAKNPLNTDAEEEYKQLQVEGAEEKVTIGM